MYGSYNLAVIGDGSTAVNAIDALTKNYRANSNALLPVNVTFFGNAPEQECGKGFAYGRLGSQFGNLTESPAEGHADYAHIKGDFQKYAAELSGVSPGRIHSASRKIIGAFHNNRYVELKQTAGIRITHRHGHVTDLQWGLQAKTGYVVATRDHIYGQFDRVVLAVGDHISERFKDAAAAYPERVFRTPYHAAPSILSNNSSDKVIVAFGTRSSFIDLVNGFFGNGFKGKIIGVSSSGQTSWQALGSKNSYRPVFLGEEKTFGITAKVLQALSNEFLVARDRGAYIPASLIENIQSQAKKGTKRVGWDFNQEQEAVHANGVTYHGIVQAVNWEKIYHGLNTKEERSIFTETLGDFILYNRANTVIAADYKQFNSRIRSGNAEIKRGSFTQENIWPLGNGRFAVELDNRQALLADYIVNCAIGPASSQEQAQSSALLGHLARRGWLSPREGSGFDVAATQRIDLLGAQARPHTFSCIGLESYGQQIESWASALVNDIASHTTRPEILSPQSYRSPANV